MSVAWNLDLSFALHLFPQQTGQRTDGGGLFGQFGVGVDAKPR
jgi:hypothetical protein